jgi:hypothetical protein
LRRVEDQHPRPSHRRVVETAVELTDPPLDVVAEVIKGVHEAKVRRARHFRGRHEALPVPHLRLMPARRDSEDRSGADYAEWFQMGRLRAQAERRARRQEWDYLARMLDEYEVADEVGNGWRPLVIELHHDLMDLDPDYRLYDIRERLGGLAVIARYHHDARDGAARLLAVAKAQAVQTCVVCGAHGQLRPERPRLHALCEKCFLYDRAAAFERGEHYANLLLDSLMSADRDYPTPEEMLAWLARLDEGP